MEWLTGILVLVTLWYVYITRKILDSNQKVVSAMREDMEQRNRPYIWIRPDFVSGHSLGILKISNTGNTPALNLRLIPDKDFFRYGIKKEDENIKNLKIFSEPIECFPPGAEIAIGLVMGLVIFNEGNAELTPPVFSFEIRFDHLGKQFSEKAVVDFRPYQDALISHDPLIIHLKGIQKALETIESKLQDNSYPARQIKSAFGNEDTES